MQEKSKFKLRNLLYFPFILLMILAPVWFILLFGYFLYEPKCARMCTEISMDQSRSILPYNNRHGSNYMRYPERFPFWMGCHCSIFSNGRWYDKMLKGNFYSKNYILDFSITAVFPIFASIVIWSLPAVIERRKRIIKYLKKKYKIQ
ncbi:MAG: hypothetical protein WCW27_06030 [Patescibacteria group bacterium]|jgi:hypothetical protein